MSTQNAVALQEQRQSQIANYLQRLTPAMADILPKHLTAERMARIALTCVRKDPKLADCIPESFAGSLLTAAAIGLEPGVNGEAYLVPYKGECTLIVGYQGLAKLFWQHPLAKHLDAQAVHEKDEFDYAYGLEPFLTHKPAIGDRGPIVAYYAVAALSTGAKAFVVLTPAEIKALRGNTRSSQIADPMHWMERKTALRQLFKLLPKSPSLQRALSSDDQPGTQLHQQLAAERTAGALEPSTVDTPDAGPVNAMTGEVVEGVIEDPPSDPWADLPVAQPGSGGT